MTCLRYCDKIADTAVRALRDDSFFQNVTGMRFDMNDDGTLRSTKKTIYVTDMYGSNYKVTVEEED
jgi:hypothetical protein